MTLGDLNNSTGLLKAGGYFGIVTAALAWYTALAGVLASTWGRSVLPTFPRSNH